MRVVSLPSRFSSVRELPLRYVVVHTTEGTDSRVWLTATGGVSAHDLIRPLENTVYELVPWQRSAWHAGRISGTPTTPLYTGHIVGWDDFNNAVWSVNPNAESYGIEVEWFARDRMPPEVVAMVALRIQQVRARTQIDLPIIGHLELSPGDRSDPGVQNLANIRAALEEDMTPEQDTRLKNIEARLDGLINQQTALAHNIPTVWLQRLFYGLNPAKGKRRGVSEAPPADILAPDA